MLPSGTRLGPYELLSPIGAGGMGEIYRARDSRLGREIAIKVLPSHLGSDADALGRFEREARAIAAVSHPNILAIHDFGTDAGVHFAVTELLEGETLRARISRGPIPWREAVVIASEIADGLTSAHSKGIVHRDLKPENVFLTSEGRVKILDFGLAYAARAAWNRADEETPTTELDGKRGAVMGTIGYMAPEQLRGEPVDVTNDIFSLGCLLLEMVTGTRAFWRETAVDTIAAVLHEEPAEIASLAKLVPPEVEQVILRCLEKSRDRRVRSARDVAMTLRAIVSGPTSEVDPIAPALRSTRRRRVIDSLAVLPFVNASADPATEYLSDGITETIINTLSRLPRLRIMASSTVFRYKGSAIDPIAAGRRLGVRAILTGRVVGIGELLVVSTELVDTEDGRHIWGEQYKRPLSGILEMQEQIAGEICDKLRIRVSGEARKQISKRHTRNSEAYQLYLKGRFQWGKRTVESLLQGISHFEEAIAKDPRFALAYAGIADSYVTLATNVPFPPWETMPKAREAAARALELDPDLAEAHCSAALVEWWNGWNREKAEEGFRTAIRLNPNYALAYDAYSMLLAEMKAPEASLAMAQKAAELDPLSPIIGVHVALPLLFAGRADDAIGQLLSVLELGANFLPALGWLGLAYERKGDFVKAIEVYERALAINDNAIIRASAAHAYAVSGRQREARAILAALFEFSAKRYVSAYDFATIYAGLREVDLALDWLEKAAADRSTWMVFLRVDHRLDPLREHARFRQLREQIGFNA